jgi:hypothetical protein
MGFCFSHSGASAVEPGAFADLVAGVLSASVNWATESDPATIDATKARETKSGRVRLISCGTSGCAWIQGGTL